MKKNILFFSIIASVMMIASCERDPDPIIADTNATTDTIPTTDTIATNTLGYMPRTFPEKQVKKMTVVNDNGQTRNIDYQWNGSRLKKFTVSDENGQTVYRVELDYSSQNNGLLYCNYLRLYEGNDTYPSTSTNISTSITVNSNVRYYQFVHRWMTNKFERWPNGYVIENGLSYNNDYDYTLDSTFRSLAYMKEVYNKTFDETLDTIWINPSEDIDTLQGLYTFGWRDMNLVSLSNSIENGVEDKIFYDVQYDSLPNPLCLPIGVECLYQFLDTWEGFNLLVDLYNIPWSRNNITKLSSSKSGVGFECTYTYDNDGYPLTQNVTTSNGQRVTITYQY